MQTFLILFGIACVLWLVIPSKKTQKRRKNAAANKLRLTKKSNFKKLRGSEHSTLEHAATGELVFINEDPEDDDPEQDYSEVGEAGAHPVTVQRLVRAGLLVPEGDGFAITRKGLQALNS